MGSADSASESYYSVECAQDLPVQDVPVVQVPPCIKSSADSVPESQPTVLMQDMLDIEDLVNLIYRAGLYCAG